MKTLYSKFLRLLVLLSLFILLTNRLALAEGTKTISPTITYNTALAIMPSNESGSYLGCTEDNRIYFRINNHSIENLYFGFNWRSCLNSGPDFLHWNMNNRHSYFFRQSDVLSFLVDFFR